MPSLALSPTSWELSQRESLDSLKASPHGRGGRSEASDGEGFRRNLGGRSEASDGEGVRRNSGGTEGDGEGFRRNLGGTEGDGEGL